MSEEMPLEIRFVTSDEWEDAIGLVWKSFLEFEGDVYPPEGVRNFEDFRRSRECLLWDPIR